MGWLPPTAKAILDRHWQIEKEIFLETPRHPRWKEEMITKAHDGLVGALNILFVKSAWRRLASLKNNRDVGTSSVDSTRK